MRKELSYTGIVNVKLETAAGMLMEMPDLVELQDDLFPSTVKVM